MTFESPICFLDVESTGADPVKDRIIELSLCDVQPDGARTNHCRRFNPGIPIPPAATEVHRITDADVAKCLPFEAFAHGIAMFINGKALAGYNLRAFDLPIIDEELRRCGLRLNLEGALIIDCFEIFRKKEPRKLADAVRLYCGREHTDAHSAEADALATADVLTGQLQRYPDLDAMTLDELAEYSRGDKKFADLAGKLYIDADGDLRYNFGKCRDAKVRNEMGFARWMLGKDFTGSTLDAIRAEMQRAAMSTAASKGVFA